MNTFNKRTMNGVFLTENVPDVSLRQCTLLLQTKVSSARQNEAFNLRTQHAYVLILLN